MEPTPPHRPYPSDVPDEEWAFVAPSLTPVRPDALLAVEHRPADVVPHPLVVEHELADRLREPVALPPALASPCALARSVRRGSARP